MHEIIVIHVRRNIRFSHNLILFCSNSHFTETVTGATTIRAYRAQHRFIEENKNRIDANVRCAYLNYASNRWLGTRVENCGNLVILFASLFAILSRDTISPGLAGLSITYSLSIVDSLNWMIR